MRPIENKKYAQTAIEPGLSQFPRTPELKKRNFSGTRKRHESIQRWLNGGRAAVVDDAHQKLVSSRPLKPPTSDRARNQRNQ
jgi:hypothetical protein